MAPDEKASRDTVPADGDRAQNGVNRRSQSAGDSVADRIKVQPRPAKAPGKAGPAGGKRRPTAAEQVKDLEGSLKELKEKNLRLLAEYENHIKRTSREKQELVAYGGTQLVQQLLPVLDDLRRTVDHFRDDDDARKDDPLLQGLELIYEKFTKALKDQGVEMFSSVGEPFDPELHEALMSRPSPDHPDGFVLEEFDVGYRYRDKVIRHSKVVVSGPAP
ncbi:MAG: nucleotide exchange factor GrpE [Candidatus Neomarinimicrobiota bacterium]